MAEPEGAETSNVDPLAVIGDWPVPNASAAVVSPGGPVATFGPVDHPFAVASVTKLLLSYACLVAVEEGTLDLDEAAGPPGASVRHLLAHAAGCGFEDGVLAPPGRRRIYSNIAMVLLAIHLGTRSAMAATDYVLDAVIEPLKMAATRLDPGAPATGACSTVSDLSRFAAELLRPTLVHRATLDLATAVAFPGLDGVLPGVGVQRPNDWGLGFEVRDHKAPHWTGTTNSPATFGHFGASGTFLWVDPALDHALVVLTDRAFGPWALDAWPVLSDSVVAGVGPTAPT
ncbi:MAG: serine hydrolase domain-containing protein [Acidimicrobiales bacterium]